MLNSSTHTFKYVIDAHLLELLGLTSGGMPEEKTVTCASHIHVYFAHSLALRTFTCASHIHLCSTHSLVSHSLVLHTFTGAFSLKARFLVSVRISLFFVVIMGRSANPIRWLVKLK